MFVEFKAKSNFSFLRGASDSREYIAQAVALGLPAIAITDVNGVYALPRAYEALKEVKDKLKLISGAEITVLDHPNITLLAKTRKGYGFLCRLITAVHKDKEKGQGHTTLAEMAELMFQFSGSQDLICIPDVTDQTNLEFLKALFKDNLYLPLCRYLDGLDEKRTEKVLSLSQKHQLKIIATNDVHYHTAQRRPLQDCLTCIREGVTVDSAGFHLFANEERYLKSAPQMQNLFWDIPEAVANTLVVAAQCTFDLSELKYSYPHEFIPEGHTAASYLRHLVYEGARKTYKDNIPQKAIEQIERELAFFAKRGDEHYFLTVQDIVKASQRLNILCQGRGSAANSIVCYVLGITSIDPIQMNLLFDRFMNEGRKEPPDIDIDFEHDRREEIIQYIYDRFGRERAAMVSAVRTYRRRSAFLEISKAVGVDVGTISANELEKDFDQHAKNFKYRRHTIDEFTQELKGFPRHLSIHSGGFVLSDEPLIELVPIEPARMDGRTIVQWDKDDLETLGLMKIDVLSIGFLTALHKATDLAGINWREIPDDDVPTYKMIQRGETHGTFQIESRAQMNMVVQTLPENFYDLVVEVALVRPSPTTGGMVRPYIQRRNLKRRPSGWKFKIGNEALEKILDRTCGIPIFQEQIMQISIDVAGFTSAEADQLRRSLLLQRSASSVNVMGEKLRKALNNAKIDSKFANDLFEYVKGYAHYGFPESHAASYASLAYKSAYMKCHYPAELVVALINSQPMGFYSVDTLMNEAKRNGGVTFLPIDPHLSVWETTMEGPKTVRMGFSHIKKIRKEDVDHLIKEREKGDFHSLNDFIFRNHFNKDVLENLALANVFEIFGLDRRHSYWQSIEFGKLVQEKQSSQLMLFNESTELQARADLFTDMTDLEKVTTDYRKLGYSLGGHLMKALRTEVDDLPSITSVQVKKMMKGKLLRYAGILTVMQRPPPAKGTAFITFEDEFGSIDTVFKNDVFEKYKAVLFNSRFLIIEGRIQKKGLGTTVLVTHVSSFAQRELKKPITNGPSPRALGTLDWITGD